MVVGVIGVHEVFITQERSDDGVVSTERRQLRQCRNDQSALLKCEIWEKWGATYGRNGWVGETQKNRLKCEIWGKWGAAYGIRQCRNDQSALLLPNQGAHLRGGGWGGGIWGGFMGDGRRGGGTVGLVS